MQAAMRSFDPVQADWSFNQVIQEQIYEGLVEYAYKTGPVGVQPLLAESWTRSEDGRVWTFVLRADARFYDPSAEPLWPGGTRPVRASDVVFSFLRQSDPAAGGQTWVLEGLIEGIDAFRTAAGARETRAAAWKAAREKGIAGLHALDERRVEIRLKRRAPEFLGILASPYCMVVPPEAVERAGKDFPNRPVGSGPFFLAEWEPPHLAVFRRTPGWRGQSDPFGKGPLPHLDEVRFQLVPEPSTQLQLFETGKIDRLSPTQIAFDRLVAQPESGASEKVRDYTIQRVDTPDITLISFDMDDPVIGFIPGDEEGNAKRKKIRHAIALAYDYARWQRLIRSDAWARPAATFLPPGLPEAAGAPACPWRRHDPARARALLAEAGFPEGEGLPELTFNQGGTSTAEITQSEILVHAEAVVGIRIRPLVDVTAGTGPGKAQIFGRGWTLDWPDAGNVLQLFYGGAAGSELNRQNFRNPEYDRLYEEFRGTDPGPERTRLVHAMLSILNEELPAIPVDHRRGYLLVQPWLRGHLAHPYLLMPCKYFRIEG